MLNIFVPYQYVLDNINQKIKMKKRNVIDVEAYVDSLLKGHRKTLAEVITLLESSLPNKRDIGLKILSDLAANFKEKTLRIGITGTPGVGKSTFIDALVPILNKQRGKIAVLAIDPSSVVSQGSILGDKTRMVTSSVMEDVFIRPTPTSNILGGAAAHTYETIKLCEFSGFWTTIIETVGVGQSEIEVDQLCDVNILLLQPGAGDEIQGIKRGILEKADIIVVNKADGPQLELAIKTKNQYSQSIKLLHHKMPAWSVPVITSSSYEGSGIADIINAIANFEAMASKDNYFLQKRLLQEENYTKGMLLAMLTEHLSSSSTYQDLLSKIDSNDGEPIFNKLLKAKSVIANMIK